MTCRSLKEILAKVLNVSNLKLIAITYHSRQHPQQNSDYTPTSYSSSYHEQSPNSYTPHRTPQTHYHYDPSDSPRPAVTPPTSSPYPHHPVDFSRSVSPATIPEYRARIADRNLQFFDFSYYHWLIWSCVWR